MQEEIKSKGKCLFCGKMLAKIGINRHLAIHLKEKASRSNAGKSFLVMVETRKGRASTPYFLCLWIDGKIEMAVFDRFLRDIWLECCDHKSDLRKRQGDMVKKIKDDFIHNLMEEDKVEEAMRFITMNYFDEADEVSIYDKAERIFKKGVVLDYDFDYNYHFSSPTPLSITVIEEYAVEADSEIVLLSRNEPLAIMCSTCKKMPAKHICTACFQYINAIFCDDCAKKHAKSCGTFNNYADRPIVNSPRMGMCKYKGGKIDKERDGAFTIKSHKDVTRRKTTKTEIFRK